MYKCILGVFFVCFVWVNFVFWVYVYVIVFVLYVGKELCICISICLFGNYCVNVRLYIYGDFVMLCISWRFFLGSNI